MDISEHHQAAWVIVTFREPCLWNRSDQEVWLFNPKKRYILHASHLKHLATHIESVSDMKTGRHYRQINVSANLANADILVERHRDRGFGDYLFLTGPLNYIKHVSGGSAKIDLYALADRGQLIEHHPALHHKVPLVGPIEYDTLSLYHFHWFIESATEFDQEPDQLNVYDALFKQMGVDPATVNHQYKRPSMTLVDKDYADLDMLYYYVFLRTKIDLRQQGYYVVAPSCNSSLRSAPYQLWLSVIQSLSKARPVVVVGQPLGGRVPSTDMSYGEFVQRLDQLGPGVISVLGTAPIRVTAALIARAVAAVTLDSGLLYVAQAMRVPAVSLWGPHAPHVRLGYDREYLDLAIWPRQACRFSPCYAYADFPRNRCPGGERQVICEVLAQVSASDVIAKVEQAERRVAGTVEVPPSPVSQLPGPAVQ